MLLTNGSSQVSLLKKDLSWHACMHFNIRLTMIKLDDYKTNFYPRSDSSNNNFFLQNLEFYCKNN
jgi:hypothetical protein